MLIATDTQRLSNLLKYELFPEVRHCRDVIVYNGAAKSFAIGDLVDATGGVPAAAANIAGIVLENVSAPATTNTNVVVLARGAAGVSAYGINLGALTLPNVTTQLLTKDIKVLTAF
jgi:hypothetical protein